MAGESGNFLLKFIADMTQVEKELSALEAKGKSAAARSSAKSSAPGSRGAAFSEALGGLDTTGLDPRAAGKARGTLVQLATYMDSIGALGTNLKGKEGVIKQIDAKFATLKGLNPQEFGAGARSGGISTNAALRGATDVDSAYVIASTKLAEVTNAKAGAVVASTALVSEADAASAAAAKTKAAAVVKAGELEILGSDEQYLAIRENIVSSKKTQALREAAVAKQVAAESELALSAAQKGERAAQVAVEARIAEVAQLQLQMDQASLRIAAEAAVERERYNRALAKATKTVAAEQGMAFHLTPGAPGGGKFSGGFGGINVLQGAKSAIQFGLPSALLYGSVTGVRDLVKEANELQVQLGIIKSQFDFATKAGADFNGLTFQDVKKQIIDVSKTSLTPADVVASVTSQLAGAFSKPDQNGISRPDFSKALSDANEALKLSAVTDLPDQEITDSLTAIQLAFDKTFGSVTEFSDLVTGVSNQFGVLTPELIKFTADLAPLAAEMGFTVQQLTGIAAVAQRASGKSGTQLSEQLGRILSGLKQHAVEIETSLSQTAEGAAVAIRLSKEFAQGDLPAVLGELSGFYDKLNSAQKETIGNLVGGRREAGTFFALLSDNSDLTKVLGSKYGQDFDGSFAKKYAEYQKTLEATVKKLKVTMQAFGLALYNSGIQKGLTFLVDNLTVLVNILSKLLGAFGKVNKVLGGVPGEFLSVGAAVFAAVKAYQALVKVQQTLLGLRVLGGATGAAGAAGAVLPGALGTNGYGPGPGGIPGAAAGGAGGSLIGRLGPSFLGSTLGRFGTSLGARGAASSGIGEFAASGTAAASALSIVAVLGAAYLTDKAVKSYIDLRGQIDKAGNNLASIVNEQLDKGVSREEILRRANTEKPSTLAKVGTFLSGQKTQSQVIQDVFQTRDKDRNQDFLSRVLGSKNVNSVDSSDVGLSQFGKEDLKGKELINKIISEHKKHPDSDKWNAAIKALYKKFPDLKAAADAKAEADAAATTKEKEYQKALEDATKQTEDSAKTLEQSKFDYAHGNITAEAYKRFIQAQIDNLNAQIAAARKVGTPDPAALDALDKALADKKALLDQLTVKPLQVKQFLTSLTGGDPVATAKQGTEAAKAALANAQTPDDRLQSAQALLNAQKDEFDAWVASAVTDAEKLRRMRQGYKLDPEALRILQGISLQTDTAVQGIARYTGGDLTDIAQKVSNAIAGYGTDTIETIKEMIQAKADQDKAVATAKFMANNALARIGGTPESLDQFQTEVGGIQGLADTQKAALDKVIKDTQASNKKGAAGGNTKDINAEAKKQSDELAAARLDFLLAQIENDPVAAARNAQAKADQQYHAAIGSANEQAAKINAQAARIRADRQLSEAIYAVQQSRTDLLIAVASAAGNDVEAAQKGLEKANAALEHAQNSGAGEDAVNAAQAQVTSSQANLRDTTVNRQLDTAEFLHDMNVISDQQLITIYSNLIANAKQLGYTQDQVQDWMLKIKSLKDGLGQDYQFNLPNIDLPTLYEVRRSGQTPGGSQNYQDNRVISIQFNANNPADAAAAAQAIIDELNRPSRFGSTAINMY